MAEQKTSYWFLVPAGGSSSRFGTKNKLLEELDGKPVFLHCLLAAAELISPDRMVLMVPAALKETFSAICRTWFPGPASVNVIEGGATRSESVIHALQYLKERKADGIAAIHDAGRPFLTAELLRRSYEQAAVSGGAVVCRKIRDTIKFAGENGQIETTVPREPLWAAETPQTFCLDLLTRCYEKAVEVGGQYTDDSQVVELFGGIRPVIVEDRGYNEKITYEQDLLQARLLLQARRKN